MQELVSSGLFLLRKEGEASCYEWRAEKVWKRYFFFNQGFIYIQMCTNPQNSVCSCSKSESQNFCPLQHPEEWKYKMLIEAHSNLVKMRDRAASRKQDWRAAWRTPGETGACELLVTPVSKLPGKAWTIS